MFVLGEVPFERGLRPQPGQPMGSRHDVPSKTYLKAAGRESSRAVAGLLYRAASRFAVLVGHDAEVREGGCAVTGEFGEQAGSAFHASLHREAWNAVVRRDVSEA